MQILELISMCQRMAGSIKEDITNKNFEKALGKIEILEGELGIHRQDYEPQEEEKEVEEVPIPPTPPIGMPPMSGPMEPPIDTTAVEAED